MMSSPTKKAASAGAESPSLLYKTSPSKRSRSVSALLSLDLPMSGANTNGSQRHGYNNHNGSTSSIPSAHGSTPSINGQPRFNSKRNGMHSSTGSIQHISGLTPKQLQKRMRVRFFLGVILIACAIAYTGLAFSILKVQGLHELPSRMDQIQPRIQGNRRANTTHNLKQLRSGKEKRYNTVKLTTEQKRKHDASSHHKNASQSVAKKPNSPSRVIVLGSDAYRAYQTLGAVPLKMVRQRYMRHLDLDPLFWNREGDEDDHALEEMEEIPADPVVGAAAVHEAETEEFDAHDVHNEQTGHNLNDTVVEAHMLNGEVAAEEDDVDGGDKGDAAEEEDPNHDPTCKPSGEWQTQSFINCNTIHELDMTLGVASWAEKDDAQADKNLDLSSEDEKRRKKKHLKKKSYHSNFELFFLGQGWFRSAWKIDLGRFAKNKKLPKDSVVLKTLRTEREYLPEYYELHRRDAVAMERLTHSEYVMDVYGYCGQSAINELANFDHPTIKSLEQLNRATRGKDGDEMMFLRLQLAASVAMGLADVHETNLPLKSKTDTGLRRPIKALEKLPGMAHYDINPRNIAIVKGGKPKLNDFNIAEFLEYDPSTNKTCGFRSRLHEPWWRAPEEMDLSHESFVDQQVDVYALGNVLFHTLTTHSPRGKMKKERMDEVREIVRRGERPELPSEYEESSSGMVKVFRKALDMCFRADPAKRATSREVADLFREAVKKYSKRFRNAGSRKN